MKKDESLHLHTLLALVRADVERRGDASPAEFGAYDDLDVSPIAVYGSKAEHERAVLALARGLAAAVGDSDDRSVAVTPD